MRNIALCAAILWLGAATSAAQTARQWTAARTLMVGDSWLTDGGAAALGITVLILPARNRTAEPALTSVLDLTRE